MFSVPEDIGNRGLQHLGAARVLPPDGFTNPMSKNAAEAAFLYDKCRRAELRANPWTFSARRVLSRAAASALSIVYATWSSSTAYVVGDVVFYTANNQTVPFICVALNTNQVPINNLSFWREFFPPRLVNPFITNAIYYPGEVMIVAGVVYINNTNIVISGPPAPDNPGWHQLSVASFTSLTVTSPLQFTTASIGANQTTPLKNIFPMPFGYLRPMSQDPKTASNPYQVSTGGATSTDFEYEEGLLLSALSGPLVFRFGADVQSVSLMEDLFCEMLACRMSMELCETITQSPQKLMNIHAMYLEYKMEAERLALIEMGSTEMAPGDVNTSRAPTLERPKANTQPQVKR